MYKWQVKADGKVVGETNAFSEFPIKDKVLEDKITEERWTLMSSARDQFPLLSVSKFNYHLVEVKE